MSRKAAAYMRAKEDGSRESWRLPSIYCVTLDYKPYKPLDFCDNPVVIIHNSKDASAAAVQRVAAASRQQQQQGSSGTGSIPEAAAASAVAAVETLCTLAPLCRALLCETVAERLEGADGDGSMDTSTVIKGPNETRTTTTTAGTPAAFGEGGGGGGGGGGRAAAAAATPATVDIVERVGAIIILDVGPCDADILKRDLMVQSESGPVSRSAIKLLQRLFLRNPIFLASGASPCQLLLKMLAVQDKEEGRQLTLNNNGVGGCKGIRGVGLVNPELPGTFVNRHLRSPVFSGRATAVFTNPAAEKRGALILEPALPGLHTLAVETAAYAGGSPPSPQTLGLIAALNLSVPMAANLAAASVQRGVGNSATTTTTTTTTTTATITTAAAASTAIACSSAQEAAAFDGRSIWFSRINFEVEKRSKQIQQLATDLTQLVLRGSNQMPTASNIIAKSSAASTTGAAVAAAPQEVQVGCLLLRGNHCVLARSLDFEWEGMRIPTVVKEAGESPKEAAVRAIEELCDVDGDEFVLLPEICPVFLYPEQRGVRGILVYLAYALSPPPPGPVSEEEDPDDLYDWYTLERATARLDPGGVAALRTISCALAAGAAAGRVPVKWGGVFGQEWLENKSE